MRQWLLTLAQKGNQSLFPKASDINIQDILSLKMISHLAPKIACPSLCRLC